MPFKDKGKKSAYLKMYFARPYAAKRRKIYQKEWATKNIFSIRQREAKRRLEKRAMCLIASARVRARSKNIAFQLDRFIDQIQKRIDHGVCELSGISFDLTPGRKFSSPSLDRINPKIGYIYENIRVICHAMNTALGDWGEEKLRIVIEGWFGSTRGSPPSSSRQRAKQSNK